MNLTLLDDHTHARYHVPHVSYSILDTLVGGQSLLHQGCMNTTVTSGGRPRSYEPDITGRSYPCQVSCSTCFLFDSGYSRRGAIITPPGVHEHYCHVRRETTFIRT